jgi:putative endonuclease
MTKGTALTRRRMTVGRGRTAETIALLLLLAKGYRPLALRFAAAGGEIDIIARRGETIAFVEVKARGLMDDARTAIGAMKRRRFSRAVRAWLSRNPWAARKTWRADAVFVARRSWPRHLEAAFEIEMP